MNQDVVRQWANALAVLGTIVVNIMANTLPINGQLTGEISDRFKVFFVPAGYVFSIWGLIYLGLIGFAIYQFLPAQRESKLFRRVGYLAAWSCLANSVWIILWHYELFTLTLVAMLALLFLLIAIYLRLEIGKSAASWQEKLFVRIPFSIYLGWITVATIANVTTLLDYLRWDGWGIAPEIWTIIMLVASLVIAMVVAFSRRDVAYLLVLVWAFVGIAIKQASIPLVANPAWIVAALVAGLLLWILLSGWIKSPATYAV